MRIVPPSATIIEKELAGLSVCQRIDKLAGVCYQRNPRPTEEDAEAFCRSLIERGHLPALEMAVVHLAMPWRMAVLFEGEKYLSIEWDTDTGKGIVSGSIRAFMEAATLRGNPAWYLLAKNFPVFFYSLLAVKEGFYLATTGEIPWQHKHVAVRVICSRAISHQLVRHRPCSFLQESQRYCRYDEDVVFVRPEWADGEWALFKAQCEMSEMMYRVRMAKGLSPQLARGALANDTKTELIMYASLPEWRHIFAMRCAKAADPEMRRIMVPLREQFLAEYPEMWGGMCCFEDVRLSVQCVQG